MKQAVGLDDLDRVPRAVLIIERWVRMHPAAIGAFTVASVGAIGIGQVYMGANGPTPLTYAFPLAVCSYSLGVVTGAVAALAISILWLLDALQHGLPLSQANFVFALRLFSNLVIVALAALAAAAARARERYVEAQEELNRLRADVVSAFSHDLRSPLTSIIGYADIMRDTLQEPTAAQPLERILANAQHLDRLIGDMLTAGAGAISAPLEISTFAPQALLEELRAEFDGNPRADQVALVWHVEPATPPLTTDRAKLASVIRNLVHNALKFTPEGRVTVRLSRDGASNAHRVEVEDTGAGIAPEALPHIFDRYYRGGRGRDVRGFGLGLFIVKRFTELIGGEVSVRSQLGQGTCFAVTLPSSSS